MQEEIVNICTEKLFNKLHALYKRPNLEASVGEILCEYEKQVQQSPAYFPNGTLKTNFAEAGLLLQGCAEVYGKQVDILYQKFINLNLSLIKLFRDDKKKKEVPKDNETDQNLENETRNQNEHKERKPREKPKVKEDSKQNTTNTAESKKKSIFDLMNERWDEQFWKFPIDDYPANYLSRLKLPEWSIEEYKVQDCSAENVPFPIEFETDAAFNDLYICQNVSQSGVCWNTLHVTEKQDRLVATETETEDLPEAEPVELGESEPVHVAQTELEEIATSEPVNVSQSEPVDLVQSEPVDVALSGSVDVELPELIVETEPFVEEVQKELRVVLQRLSADVLKRYCCENKENQARELVVRLESLPKHICNKNITLKWNVFRFSLDILLKTNIFRLPTDILGQAPHLERSKAAVRKRRSTDEQVIPLKKCKSYNLEDFESFCESVFISEGILPPRPPEPENPIDDQLQEIDHQAEDEVNEDTTLQLRANANQTFQSESGYETDSLKSFRRKRINSSVDVSVTSEDAEALIISISDDPKTLELYRKYTAQSNELEKWEKFISEKINQEETEFDIHEYGTTILNSFPQEDSFLEQQICFQSLVEDKPISQVAKFFVATLQLANTNNVEIIETKPGTLEPDNMHIKYLSSSRYHEEMDSFHAPSETSFREKLLNMEGQNMTSTPIQSQSAVKRTNINHFSKEIKRRRIDYDP